MSAYSELQLSSSIVGEGAPYDAPGQDVPQEVVDLVLAGDRMGALRKYRELTAPGSSRR